jgi:hypothetical protein
MSFGLTLGFSFMSSMSLFLELDGLHALRDHINLVFVIIFLRAHASNCRGDRAKQEGHPHSPEHCNATYKEVLVDVFGI